MRTKRIIADTLIYILLAVLCIIWLLPIIWLFLQSFGDYDGAALTGLKKFWPDKWTFDNYINLFNNRVLDSTVGVWRVYGDPLIHPQNEDYRGNVNPIGIRACYDEGKRCAESLFFDYHRNENVDIKVIRIFNTYGENMDPNDGRVVSNFICQALSGKDISIYGDGSQTRSFCYVDDLIDIIIMVMNSDKDFTGPINTGNPGEFSIKELAQKVIEKTGSKSKIIYKDLPLDDPTQRRPDISLAKSKFGWEPKINLDEGLDKSIEYFKKVIKEFKG